VDLTKGGERLRVLGAARVGEAHVGGGWGRGVVSSEMTLKLVVRDDGKPSQGPLTRPLQTRMKR
jgi:hypothetical protein